MRAFLLAPVVLVQLTNPVLGETCFTSPALAAAYKSAMDMPMSLGCTSSGQWAKFNNMTSKVVMAHGRSYLTLACAVSACRKDFDASAAALNAVNCDEAQDAAAIMDGVRRLCQSLSPALAVPRCSRMDYEIERQRECPDIQPLVLTDYWFDISLPTVIEVCRKPKCLETIREAVTELSDCYVDYGEYVGLPMSRKHVLQTYLPSFCDPPVPTPPPNDDATCKAKLASLYATPFSTNCTQAIVDQVPRASSQDVLYVMYETIYDRFASVVRGIDAYPSCAADVAALMAQVKSLGPCASNVSLGFDIFRLAHTAAFTPAASPSVKVCNESVGRFVWQCRLQQLHALVGMA